MLTAQSPAPGITGDFDALQQLLRDETIAMRITVGQSHDTFAVAEQFAQAAAIELRISALHAVNGRQIVSQRLCPLPVQRGRPGCVRQSFEILVIRVPFRPFGQQEELFGRRDRHQLATRGERAYVQRRDMPGKPAVTVIVHQHRLGSVSRMLVAERTGTHRTQHHLAGFVAVCTKG